MDRKEYIEKVEAKAVPTLRPFIAPTVDILGDTLRLGRYEVADIIEIADRLASELKKMGVAKGQPEQGEVPVEPTVTSEFLGDLITPWVEDVRQELFDSRVAPFFTFEQAKKWVEEQREETSKWLQEKTKEYGEKFRIDAKRETETKAESKPQRKIFEGKYPFVAHAIEEGDVDYPPFVVCQYRANKIANVSGFDTSSVFYYILMGVRPVLTKVQAHVEEEESRLPSGDSLVNRLVIVEMRGELSFEELRHLYQQIRQDLGVKRTKAFNEKHLQLYQVVRHNGVVPKGKGTKHFWEAVQEDMNDWINKNGKGDPYTTWRGVKRAYDLLSSKLRSQLSLAKNDKAS